MSDQPSPPSPAAGSPPALSIEAALDDYLAYLEGKRRPSTIRTYAKSYRRLAQYLPDAPTPLPPEAPLSELSVEHLIQFPTWLHRRGLARSTIARHLAAVQQFVSYLFREELSDMDAHQYERMKAVYRDARKGVRRRLPRVPGREAVADLIAQARERPIPDGASEAVQRRQALIRLRDVAMLETLRATGIRVGELVALQRWNLDHENQRLLIETTKSKEPRSLPVDDRAWMAIVAYLTARQDGETGRPLHLLPLFCRHDRRAGLNKRKPLSVRSVERVMARYREEADLEIPITPHSLRHQLGTDVLRATGNMRLVQKVLGHQHISTSQVYTHLADADVDAAFEALEGM